LIWYWKAVKNLQQSKPGFTLFYWFWAQNRFSNIR
jgi:hypothetical protein